MICLNRTLCGLALILMLTAVMRAEENAVKPSAGELSELVKNLDHESFEVREAAVKALLEAGAAAVPYVIEAATGESLEASTRAFGILDKWLGGDEEAQKQAARKELEKLAGLPEEDPSSRRSKALLAKWNSYGNSFPSSRPALPAGLFHVPAARMGVARVEMRAMAGLAAGVRGRSVSVSIANGKKTMNVTEGDFKATIVEDEKTGISMKVTEKNKDGKEKTTEYAAKDLEELKKKHPEGHKVYEKYAGALGGLKIKIEAAEARAAEFREAVEEEREALEAKIQAHRKQLEAMQLKAKAKIQRVELAPRADAPAVEDAPVETPAEAAE